MHLPVLLDSWDRQSRIVDSVADLVTETNRGAKPSEDGWPLDYQLAHIHQVRRYWTSQVNPDLGRDLPPSFDDNRVPITSLEQIRSGLKLSSRAVREAVRLGIEHGGQPAGGYDHPMLLMQHMIWHEGWHVGLIFLALRLAGEEPPEEWEELNVWGQWRAETW